MASRNAAAHIQPTISEIDQALAKIQQAGRLTKQKQFDQAALILESIKSSLPELPELNYLLAQAYHQQGYLRKAMLAALDEYLSHPENARIETLLDQLAAERQFYVSILTFQGKTLPARCPSISLFMIVRNEEENLLRCLDSVKGIVQEMIIVDTGSTDRTVEIARSFGARVFFFEWCDDFAAARNEALKHATGDWLLMMDADNWLEPKDSNRIQEAAASGLADAFVCKQVTWKGDHIFSQDSQFRLWRNHLGLVYVGALHESLDMFNAPKNLVAAETNIAIQHVPFFDSDEALQRRRERNMLVIEKALEKDPDNISNRILQVCLLDQGGKPQEAACKFEKLYPQFPERLPTSLYLQTGYASLLKSYGNTGDIDAIRKVLRLFLIDGFNVYWVLVYCANAYLNILNDPQKTLALHARLSKLKPNERDRTALNARDLETEVFVLKIRALLYSGQLEDARRVLNSKKIKTYRFQNAGAARLLAKSAAEAGDWLTAAHTMAAAICLAGKPAPEDWLILGQYEASCGNNELCIGAYQHGLAVYSDHPDLLLTCANAALEREHPGLSIECYVRAALLDPQNQAAKDGLQAIATRLGLQPLQLIRNQGVNWSKEKVFSKARAALEVVFREDPADQQAGQLLAMLEKVC
jgi:glycosyltransferase involved in cell wall biosynthesis